MRKKLRNLASSALLMCVLSNCADYAEPGKTVLAPTPIAVVFNTDQKAQPIRTMDLATNVPVFICSSRNKLENSNRVDPFGNKRSQHLVPYLAEASVSFKHIEGLAAIRSESLTAITRKRTKVTLESLKIYKSPNVTPFSSDRAKKKAFETNGWLQAIRKKLDQGTRREVTVFVHGYNTHLVSNTELLAEVSHFLGRDGAVINYEWPSTGKLLGYAQDKGNAEHGTRMFRSFISRIAITTGAKKVRIIAHSAGNPIVVNALKELRLSNKNLTANQLHAKYRISQVIMAAPDMDSMSFMNAVFDRFYEMTPNVTVYASPEDKALLFSSKLFGFSRLGNAIGGFTDWEKNALRVAKSVRLIDVTVSQKYYGSWLGHGYFHRDPWVSSDILLSATRPDPKSRGLVKNKDNVFWEFPENYPQRLQSIKR